MSCGSLMKNHEKWERENMEEKSDLWAAIRKY